MSDNKLPAEPAQPTPKPDTAMPEPSVPDAIPTEQARNEGTAEGEPPTYQATEDNPYRRYIMPNIHAQHRPCEHDVIVIPIDSPIQIYCPYCQKVVNSEVDYIPSLEATCWSVLLCFICWPCFWLPFVTRACLDKVHRCSECRRVIGISQA
ncbi:hypothetical protein K493DRAFT_316398 [Basidiobolus meristosporus CBS 931.73]|uniref:LITAF domain-containing protein n=1 Tax=Basidiobolus meristosporus CBS 931.73 TaxID=1314790 RepID=A0A1Y1Y4E3_9FUNG|nr:hypothetical protein K493DRAFT_316398 [Basidiobolus meristosporus CBS 931.73]|eukprot:ORX92765.1 hypothetical protein K493DRAFT_316398 [Basidiobolus meristosporus CBS 931.73]